MLSCHVGSGEDDAGNHKTISDLPNNRKIIPEATPHRYDYISNDIYSKGEPEDLAKHKWYHGKITTDQADAALSFVNRNTFFVRHFSDELVLSKTNHGYISHTTIHRSPKGYQLEGNSMLFDTVPAMIAHYQQSLGTPVEKVPSGKQIVSPNTMTVHQ